jgi:hypothetical protein
MSRRVGRSQSGRRTQNSPSENRNGPTVQNKDFVDGNLTTSEQICRRKLWPMAM